VQHLPFSGGEIKIHFFFLEKLFKGFILYLSSNPECKNKIFAFLQKRKKPLRSIFALRSAKMPILLKWFSRVKRV